MSEIKQNKFWNKPMIISASVSGLIIFFFIVRWYVAAFSSVSTDDAFVETDLSPVNSRIMGYVREVFVNEHDIVKTGDLLLKLDDVDSKLELSFKEAKLKKAKADDQRATQLRKQKALSESDLELADATLAGINAEVDGGLLKLKYTDVVSPIDGMVAKKSAQPGQFVQPGQSLFVLVPIDHAWVKANFKENQISSIQPGQKVKITADAYSNEDWEGTVDYVYPSSVASLSLLPPENATGNFTKVVQRFPVKISFVQKENKPLRPGMSVETTIAIK